MPQKTPGEEAKLEKPVEFVTCPRCIARLTLKGLQPLKFVAARGGKESRHQDPITHESITNNHVLVALKPNGGCRSGDWCVILVLNRVVFLVNLLVLLALVLIPVPPLALLAFVVPLLVLLLFLLFLLLLLLSFFLLF